MGEILNNVRAQVLVDALPYIQKYNNKILVVKYGGNAMTNKELKQAVMDDIVLLSLVGVKVVLVHGGGPEISDMLKRLNIESKFIGGLRYTDEAAVDVVKMVLSGKVNKELGSTCIYPKNAPQPMKEDCLLTSPLEYTNEEYAIAKIAGLKMCESYNLQYGTNYIAVMPTNLYGPNDNFHLENSHVMPAMMRKIYLAKLIHEGDWHSIEVDMNKRPINPTDKLRAIIGEGNVDGSNSHERILKAQVETSNRLFYVFVLTIILCEFDTLTCHCLVPFFR